MRLIAVLIALALTMLGCGGSEEGSDSPTTVTTAATATTAADATSQPPTTNDAPDNGSISPTNCPELWKWASDSVAANQAAFSGGGTNADGIEFTADYFQEFADRAPAEIGDDLLLFADAYRSFYQALAELGLDFTDPASLAGMDAEMAQALEEAASLMDTDELEEASDNIAAYLDRECG